MKKLMIPGLLLLAMLLYGCPYDSTVPIDEPRFPAIRSLFGQWKQPNLEKSYAAVSRYQMRDTMRYRVVYNSWTAEKGSYQVKIFKAQMSEVAGAYFFNIAPESKTSAPYFILGIRWNQAKDSLWLRPVNGEGAPRFSDSPALKSWIEANMTKKDFFEPEEVFVRAQ